MSIALKPSVTEQNGNISSIFNLNNFYHANDYATKADLLSYANLYTANFFQYLNTFANGLYFAGSINGISDTVFAYVAYLPNIIFELSNFAYDSANNSTNISGNSYFETSSINTNCNIGTNLNVDSILNQKIISNTIQVNDLSCTNLNINGKSYYEIVCFIYLNNVCLPIQKSNLISSFNISPITSFYFTLKNNYRLDVLDVNDIILFSYSNNTNDYIYFQPISYNSNMIKINLYNSLNVII
jgi:hypothetical protein